MKTTSHNIFERELSIVSLSFYKIPKLDKEICTKKWVFFISIMLFTSNHVYSVICNKSEKLGHDFFNDNFSTESGTPNNNIPLFDGFNHKFPSDTHSYIYIYIFTLNSLMLHRTSIFINSVYPVICHHPLLCLPLLLVHSILLQNHKLKLYLNIPGLVDITVMEVCLMEINSKREHFGFLISVLNLLRSFNTLNYWIMTTLKLIFNPFLKKVYFFVVVLSKITYYDSCMLHSFLTDIYAKASTLMQ